ncbi:MAG TPA: chlorite dismutase family protein [Bryobacteraceae bacterium]|nr:chlorite dismutase family protein [Bryobacteraceae bacterium]
MYTLFADVPEPDNLRVPVRGRYRVDTVHILRGPAPAPPSSRSFLFRIEAPEPLSLPSAVQLGGTAGAAQYTDPAAPTAAANGLGPLPAPCRAVLIPLRKSKSWWDLDASSRRAYFHASPTHPNHTDVAAPYIKQIHRRLFHARGTTPDYDFLTYFEFLPQDESAFRKLLAALRDVRRNPEWNYIDREWEIWMTKLS